MVATLVALAVLQQDNVLTKPEAKAGWKLLFDGKTTKGWRYFQGGPARSGWQVKDGVLSIVDPAKAGDIVTDEKYDWFELTLDYNLAPGGNSGIMVRVADDNEAIWHSGPEVQIYDHAPGPGVETSGYLYELYKPDVDASRPAGQWNHLRIVLDPKKSATFLNGVKYYEYQYGSPDFWERVKKSKFTEFPQFAKLDKGRIGIQGDHGQVSFKNIKLRVIKPGK